MDPDRPKPSPPPKPLLLKARPVSSTAERFLKESPVPREKPPLAPKPVLPIKRTSRVAVSSVLEYQKKTAEASSNILQSYFNQSGSSSYFSSSITEVVVNRLPSQLSPSITDAVTSSFPSSLVGKLTLTEAVQHQHVLNSTGRTRGDSESSSSSETETASTSAENSQCDADKIIQDTWTSLQERLCTRSDRNTEESPTDSNEKVIARHSALYPSENSTKLPLNVNSSVSKLVESSSKVTNDLTFQNVVVAQFSSKTPVDIESEEEWCLVNDENKSCENKLPSDSENCPFDSSLHSNSSFLFPDVTTDSHPDSSSSYSRSSVEASPSKKLITSISDGDVTLRNKTTGEHTRVSSWGEDNNSLRSRTDSVGNESFDGSFSTVRQRVSSFFGSFGKGGKTREKRASSLFYYNPEESSQMESSDSERTSRASLNEAVNTTIVNSTAVDKQTLQVHNDWFDRDSNQSSISDESFDTELCNKSENTNKEGDDDLDPVEKNRKRCFNVVKELMTSERTFIDVLKLLCHDFRLAVEKAGSQKYPVISSTDFNKIINHLPQLLSLNEEILKDIESRLEHWNDQPKVADVIVKKGPFLKLYLSYIQNFESQTEYLEECCKKNAKFAEVVKDFEKSERCKKLALQHYMLKPIQRIPQYKLLLENYLKYQEPDSVDFADTQTALKIVSDVADHINSRMEKDHLSKLLSIQSQLGDYEIIKPGRYFVKEGELYKLCRKDMQQRFFILLSDCLLYTSYYGSMTGLKVKSKLPLAGMKVCTSQNKDCATEFSVITSTRSFTLRAKNQEEFDSWVEALQKAIKDYNSRQMTFLRQIDTPMSASAEPLKIGREAPVWIQDKKVTMCQICTAAFTMTFRRHHCRACGKVVCAGCSEYKAPMLYKRFQSDRVCTGCFNYLLEELDDPSANMAEVVKKELNLDSEEEVLNRLSEIRSSFKKLGQSSGKKVQKYIPTRLKEVTANDSGSQMSGWLLRRSRARWKRLWFVLKEQVLYVYKASEDIVAIESTPVLGYSVEKVNDGEYDDMAGEGKEVFKLVHPGQPPLVFAADPQCAERWIEVLQEANHF